MLLFLIPRKQYSFRWTTDDATSIVAATLLVIVVSAGKKADLQRLGMLSSLREISVYSLSHYFAVLSCVSALDFCLFT